MHCEECEEKYYLSQFYCYKQEEIEKCEKYFKFKEGCEQCEHGSYYQENLKDCV